MAADNPNSLARDARQAAAAPDDVDGRTDAAAGCAAEPLIAVDALAALFAPLTAFDAVVLAVSGGGDSMALLHLAARWRTQRGQQSPRIIVATVDHGLRTESRGEAEWVVQQARDLGFQAHLLSWDGDKPATGIQDAARRERYRLLGELANSLPGLGRVAVVTAHTADDQAETLLMRLARGSGIDGLAGMAPERPLSAADAAGVMLMRPLLSISGSSLRATLQARGIGWIEDPSNAVERFERVRIRKAARLLAEMGFSNDRLAVSARRIARARAALLEAQGELAARASLDLHGGAYASFDVATWRLAPEELRLRMLGDLIGRFGGSDAPVSLASLEDLTTRASAEGFDGATLAGAIVTPQGDELRIWREDGRGLPVLTLQPGETAIWDGRFRVRANITSPSPVEVRALGRLAFANLRRIEGWPDTIPAAPAATLPAIWRGDELVAVPFFADWFKDKGHFGREIELYSAEFLA
ncbi:tRNA(Ile)-lysidine synthetase [Hyphomicrobium sulfonivorans]|uniref:tRNA(Ile)-lysidine synthase n=1 Tax=Hyphomicrobium sulfonivorans TaxID=121290 RepID=A0A109B8I1_HYPSL|nr:tRNA lysidine(34) synthetase TilS [Hyphomicrobium sulfonivorans]KWT64166.1 tRNA(Ile)-lysidine synthetase [Hyphomicrobium sulfonivorans]